jgi:hypothetical protein
MIFLLFFSSKKMIYSHHLKQRKRGQATFFKHTIDSFSFKLIVIVGDFKARQSQAVIRESGLIFFILKK